MPYFRRDNSLIHFVHIPKTAGRSVCKLLKKNGWTADISMYDNIPKGLIDHPHFELYDYYKIKSDYSFTIVRNPEDRFLSGLYFLMMQWELGVGDIPENPANKDTITGKSVIQFMHGIFTEIIPKYGIHVENNFYLPQHLFIGDDTAIFKYEDHIPDILIEDLKNRKIISKDSTLPHKNKSCENKVYPDWMFAPDVSKYFFDLYGADYKLFDYKIPVEIDI